jgi:hypothetical protein
MNLDIFMFEDVKYTVVIISQNMNNCRQNKNCRTENMVTDTTKTMYVAAVLKIQVLLVFFLKATCFL